MKVAILEPRNRKPGGPGLCMRDNEITFRWVDGYCSVHYKLLSQKTHMAYMHSNWRDADVSIFFIIQFCEL